MFISEEKSIINHLVNAWNIYVKLPKQHPDDIDEFRRSIHSAQQLIAIRGVRRKFPSIFPIFKKTGVNRENAT